MLGQAKDKSKNSKTSRITFVRCLKIPRQGKIGWFIK